MLAGEFESRLHDVSRRHVTILSLRVIQALEGRALPGSRRG